MKKSSISKRVRALPLLAVLLAAPFVETQADDWSTPVQVDTKGSVVTAQLATDTKGNAFAVWSQFDGATPDYGVWVNKYAVDKGWGSPKRISNYVGESGQPRIAMNTRGEAMAIWTQPNGLWSSRYTPSNGWASPKQVEAVTTNLGYASVTLDGAGNGAVVYLRDTSVYARRYVAGSGWKSATLVATTADVAAGAPVLAMNARGQAMVVWSQYDYATFSWSLWNNRLSASGTWSGATLIPNAPAGGGAPPRLGMDALGNAVMAWDAFDATTSQSTTYASNYRVSGGWTAAMSLQADATRSSDHPTLSVNTKGEAMVVWRETDFSSVYRMHYSRYVPGSGWTTTRAVDVEKLPFGDASPRVILSETGNADLVMLEHNLDVILDPNDPFATYPLNVFAYHYRAGSGWGRATNLQPGLDSVYDPPEVVLSNGREALATWILADGAIGQIKLWASHQDD